MKNWLFLIAALLLLVSCDNRQKEVKMEFGDGTTIRIVGDGFICVMEIKNKNEWTTSTVDCPFPPERR